MKRNVTNATLILISGPPGVGKSTLARAVAKQLRAIVIDKDTIDEPFSPNDRGTHYTTNIEPKVLAAMLNLAALNLALGLTVILDAPWSHILLNTPSWIERIATLVRETRATLVVLECAVDETTLRRRIAARGLTRDAVKLTDEGWAAFRRHDRLGERIPLPHIVIDATQSPDRIVQQALAALHNTINSPRIPRGEEE